MSEEFITDKELDRLLLSSRRIIKDDGFSAAVMRKLRRRKSLSSMLPVISGSLGALIAIAVLPRGWLSSFLLRFTNPLFNSPGSDSNELLMLLASYGIGPSMLWIFLAVPLLILPFALRED